PPKPRRPPTLPRRLDSGGCRRGARLLPRREAPRRPGRRPPAPGRRHGLVAVFSGQGGLWPLAGRELLDQEPAFRAVYDECDLWLGANEGRSLVEELARGFEAGRLLDPAFAQSHQFALQVALASLWRS